MRRGKPLASPYHPLPRGECQMSGAWHRCGSCPTDFRLKRSVGDRSLYRGHRVVYSWSGPEAISFSYGERRYPR